MVDVRSPLAHRSADLASLDAVEIALLTQIDVRCAEADAARLGFPVTPNTVTGDMTRGVLWLGPDEWLVVAAPGDPRRSRTSSRPRYAARIMPWSTSARTAR